MSRVFTVFLCLLSFALTSFAQAPLTINGVADQSTYTDLLSYSVPVTPGFSYTVLLDGARVPPQVTNPVNQIDYHELSVWRTNAASGQITNRVVRFIVQASSRGNPEKGLIVWTPYPPIPSTADELAGAQLHLVIPPEYPAGLDLPVAAWIDDGHDRIIRGNGWLTAPGFEASAFRLVRGHGSGFLPAAAAGEVLQFRASLAGLSASNQVQIETNTPWINVSGTLGSSTSWPGNSRIALVGHFTIPAGITLSIGAGSIIRINPLVNITNSGTLVLDGTLDRPIVLTPGGHPAPERNTGAWGGIIMRGGHLLANGAIFTGGGGATSFNFSPGSSHRSEQALLLIHSGSTAFLTNCFAMNQAGQILNGYNSEIILDHCLLQRAITSGESVGGTFIVNHSAILEFPAIDDVYNATIADADYDATYFTTGTHIFNNSLVGFSKDDAIDSGSGGAGTVLVTNCWIESALHEALAWSGGGRQTWTYDSVLLNCGQGIEAGWTEGSADGSPNCFAERLLSTANSIGARFGDNYDWTYYGLLRLTNSLLLHNYRDIYAKTWNTSGSSWNTNQWVDRLAQMDLRSNYLTEADSRFPSNSVWDASTDAERLSAFMSTPSEAAVGIGFAVWTNQFAMSGILDGIPVRLSSFTTHPVSVSYTFAGPAGPLASGTLSFSPGETVKKIFPAGFNLSGQSPLHITLDNAQGGEVTGESDLTFAGSIPSPALSLAVAGAQTGMERMGEGVPVRLSSPAAHTITAEYRFLAPNDRVLSGGTVTFRPGETLEWINAPPVAVGQYSLVRFELFSPNGAPLSGAADLLFVASEPSAQPEPRTLISRGGLWKYLDDGSNQSTTWRFAGFPDTVWASGPAQLGFGDGDEATPIRRTNANTGTTNITFYFRSEFVITNPAAFTNLSMWLLRDDGGVVCLNGNEVFRSDNMPQGQISFNTFANSTGENTIDTGLLSITNLVTGTNLAAVEIHQQALTSSDVSFDFELIANPLPAVAASQELRAGLFHGDLTLAWGDPEYLLETAGTLNGPWNVVNGPSPVTVTPASGQMFFRLRR